MKIGFGFGNSLRDIVAGKVALNDVIMVVCRTHMKDKNQLAEVVESYLSDFLRGLDPVECMAIALRLWDSGRLHQPRMYGAMGMTVPQDCLWMDVVPSVLTENSTVQQAWETYRVALRLGEDIPKFEGTT